MFCCQCNKNSSSNILFGYIKFTTIPQILAPFFEKMLPDEHRFFYQDGAKAATANNRMTNLRNIIWGDGDYKNNTLHRRRPLNNYKCLMLHAWQLSGVQHRKRFDKDSQQFLILFDVTTSYNSVDRAAWLGKVTSQRHACRTGNKMAAWTVAMATEKKTTLSRQRL
jgi:hypothetical protein